MIYAAMALLIFLSLCLGLWAAKGQAGTDDYFIGGRKLNRWSVGISAGATANSGFIVVGAVGMGYTLGLSSLLYPLAWLIGDLVFWLFFAEKINAKSHQSRAITLPEMLGQDVSSASVRYVSAIIILILLIAYAAAQFIASGKVISGFFDISYLHAMYLTLVVVLGYCMWGGFKSSVYTDVMQGLAMILLTAAILIWGLIEVGGVTTFIQAILSIDAAYSDILGGRSALSLLLFVVGFAFAGFGFSMSQPQVTTRIMAASSDEQTRGAKWVYIGFLHFTWMGMCIIGMITRLMIPDLHDAESALPKLASEYFSPLFIGAVLAGMVATIVSSLDSLLVSSAGTLAVDFGVGRKISERQKGTWYKGTILMTGILSLAVASLLEATVFQAALFAATVLAASIGALMTIMILDMPRNGRSMLSALLIGLLVSILWRVSGLNAVISDGVVGFVCALMTNAVVIRVQKAVRTITPP